MCLKPLGALGVQFMKFTHIPSNGILKTSTTEPEYGKASDKYFYVDGDGERVVISPENIRGTIGGEEGKPVIQTIIID